MCILACSSEMCPSDLMIACGFGFCFLFFATLKDLCASLLNNFLYLSNKMLLPMKMGMWPERTLRIRQ